MPNGEPTLATHTHTHSHIHTQKAKEKLLQKQIRKSSGTAPKIGETLRKRRFAFRPMKRFLGPKQNPTHSYGRTLKVIYLFSQSRTLLSLSLSCLWLCLSLRHITCNLHISCMSSALSLSFFPFGTKSSFLATPSKLQLAKGCQLPYHSCCAYGLIAAPAYGLSFQ